MRNKSVDASTEGTPKAQQDKRFLRGQKQRPGHSSLAQKPPTYLQWHSRLSLSQAQQQLQEQQSCGERY